MQASQLWQQVGFLQHADMGNANRMTPSLWQAPYKRTATCRHCRRGLKHHGGTKLAETLSWQATSRSGVPAASCTPCHKHLSLGLLFHNRRRKWEWTGRNPSFLLYLPLSSPLQWTRCKGKGNQTCTGTHTEALGNVSSCAMQGGQVGTRHREGGNRSGEKLVRRPIAHRAGKIQTGTFM